LFQVPQFVNVVRPWFEVRKSVFYFFNEEIIGKLFVRGVEGLLEGFVLEEVKGT
jgi:hypothetical protein